MHALKVLTSDAGCFTLLQSVTCFNAFDQSPKQAFSTCRQQHNSIVLSAVGPLERAATPEAPPLADATGQHAALVLLQRLLRGRAVQNEMFAGKAAQLQLVRELRLGLEGTAGEHQ